MTKRFLQLRNEHFNAIDIFSCEIFLFPTNVSIILFKFCKINFAHSIHVIGHLISVNQQI